jgi:hypothetical protein
MCLDLHNVDSRLSVSEIYIVLRETSNFTGEELLHEGDNLLGVPSYYSTIALKCYQRLADERMSMLSLNRSRRLVDDVTQILRHYHISLKEKHF